MSKLFFATFFTELEEALSLLIVELENPKISTNQIERTLNYLSSVRALILPPKNQTEEDAIQALFLVEQKYLAKRLDLGY